MSACSVCGRGKASDDYGRCSRCSYFLTGGKPKGRLGTTFGSEDAWIEERERTAEDETVVERRGQA